MANAKSPDGNRHLITLYTIVVALSTETAAEAAMRSFDTGSIACSMALLTTMVPFYIGAVRHLEGGPRDAQHAFKAWPLVDFGFLFMEALLFLFCANAVLEPRVLMWGLVVLLAVDIIWAVVSREVIQGDPDARASLDRWLRWNTLFLGLCLLARATLALVDQPPPTGTALALTILVAAVLRSAVDLWWNLDFYLGPKTEQTEAALQT